MKRIIFFFMVCILILLFVSFFDFAQGGQKANGKISPKVKDKVERGEKVRVFINIEKNYDRRIFNGVKEDIAKIIGEKKIINKFEDSFSAIIDKSDLEKLEQDGRFVSVEPVGVRRVFLQNSVGLINGTPSYSLQVNSINLTGKDRTICIIDSGANYSHPDLGGCYGNNSVTSGCKVVGGWDYCSDDSICSTQDNDPIDANGHGTHMAGIAAANGTIKGVARDSKIVILKVCNSTGSCFDDAIKSGINWCVGNASTYNISVISMSLGGGLNTNYCNDDPLAGNINTAVGNNIPVVIASGNDGSTTGISAPACVQNATPIGSIREDDATVDYNRNSLVLLLAPGVSINSTYLTSLSSTGYISLSGTSMSAPHAAGAIAIISQFLNLTRQIKTPKQIENSLNSSGKRITDSGSGLTFSRINIYNTIISLDINAPNVSLVGPTNRANSINVNQTFRCNATDLALKNITFYLWNSTSNAINTTSSSVSGSSYGFELNVTNMSIGTYSWNCLYFDENNNSAFAVSNFSLTVADNVINLISPSDNLISNKNQTYSCNATFINQLRNATFYLWNSTNSEVNKSNISINGTSDSTTFSFNFTYEDSYKWNCFFVDNSSAGYFDSSNFSITYDSTKPNLNVTSPVNNSWLNGGFFNVSLNENGSCFYSLNFGVNNYSMSSSDNKIFNSSNLTLAQGSGYNLTYYCNDSAGNLNGSGLFNFNIDLIVPNVSLVNPANGYSVTGTSTITFEYNVADNLNITSCDLVLNNIISAYNSSPIVSGMNNISYSVSAGGYNWQINCTDTAGNVGNSSLRSLTVNSPASGTSGSGGTSSGGGSAVSTHNLIQKNLTKNFNNNTAQKNQTQNSSTLENSEKKNQENPSTITGEAVRESANQILFKTEIIIIIAILSIIFIIYFFSKKKHLAKAK